MIKIIKNTLILTSVIVLISLSILAFTLHRTNFQDVIIYSVNEDSHYLPARVIQRYLYNFRGSEQDINSLEKEAGITIAFDIENKVQRRNIFNFLLEKGININKKNTVSGLYPIHEVILRNDVEAVKQLIKNGADLQLKDSTYQKNALAFSKLLIKSKPDVDRHPIVDFLTQSSSKTIDQ